MQHFRIDETPREVRMYLPTSLHCSLPSSNRPGSHLIRAYRVEMGDLQLFIASLDDTTDL